MEREERLVAHTSTPLQCWPYTPTGHHAVDMWLKLLFAHHLVTSVRGRDLGTVLALPKRSCQPTPSPL